MPNLVLTSHMPNQSVRVLKTVILIIIFARTHCAVWCSILLSNDCSSVLDIGPVLELWMSSLKDNKLRLSSKVNGEIKKVNRNY